ncbi:lactococcin 972 family bacteriocin [Streptococcus danieliae]|uniref:Lactococcin 972 family bacteriocin n=1 Tax=Streptococcus danieliae TaxID=747656 RepID=A0A7Z0LDB8_9STRE|nr:lactococcin 972 family bacteriocin [Streptococcus danieliae]MBF0717445.1 lactococcin 972 family bacteriocin [Streptococcus danieliae]NYS49375.1 lactococcin 972 family bacteriocin [Streptococcus danieliae]
MLKTKKLAIMVIAFLSVAFVLPVSAVSHRGGEWTYGAHHNPNNWGAFSNYYHGGQHHWSYVGSTARNNQRTAYAGAHATSYAFINTNVGEYVVFDAGW